MIHCSELAFVSTSDTMCISQFAWVCMLTCLHITFDSNSIVEFSLLLIGVYSGGSVCVAVAPYSVMHGFCLCQVWVRRQFLLIALCVSSCSVVMSHHAPLGDIIGLIYQPQWCLVLSMGWCVWVPKSFMCVHVIGVCSLLVPLWKALIGLV